MKKGLLTIGLFAFLAIGMVSCESSKKGAWTDSDKDELRDVLATEGEITDTLLQNCMIGKYEAAYESFYDADTDEKNNEVNALKFYTECMTEQMK
tara:strand:- start:68 stop:352 length:285 start_codon:yes stop_codon:yes gene_type:complete